MLLTNRRHRFLSIALAGMEIACFLPLIWLAWFFIQSRQDAGAATLSQNAGLSDLGLPDLLLAGFAPTVAAGFGLLLWLLYLLATDLINARAIETPRRELILFGIMALSTLVLIRLLLYPDIRFFDLGWIGNTLGAIFNFTDGWRAELAVILLNLFLWIRVVLSLGRSLTFMSVGLSFRLSLLLAIFGNAFLYAIVGLSAPLQFFVILLGCGLLAVALARIDEKSLIGQHSSGAVLSWGRLGLICLVVAATLAFGLLLTELYTPQNIRTVLAWFSPLWIFLGGIVIGILSAIFWLIAPLLNWLIETLRGMMENMELFGQESQGEFGSSEPPTVDDMQTVTEFLQEWTLIRYGLVFLAMVAVGAFLWFFFVRPYLRQRTDEEEDIEQEPANLGLGGIRSGLNRLRDLAKLIGRFGLSLQLLDAISVENMYANLGRIARQRGYPRQPNQPPDEYISALREAFPGQADGLHRITSAYMRVHYGDQAIGREELTILRTLYQAIQETPEPIEVA